MSRTTEFQGFVPRRAGAAAAGWAALRRLAGLPGQMVRARRLMGQLGAMADHELRDIGLTRLDLMAASALPFDADPSLELRRRAEGRRRSGAGAVSRASRG